MSLLYSPQSYAQHQKGFTLLEMLIAVLIFSLSLVALMTISSRGVRAVGVASQRVVAQYLAQEGIELIEAVRDDNFLDISADWLQNLDECIGQSCQFDIHGLSAGDVPVSCGGACQPLLQDGDNIFGYNGSTETPFTRELFIVAEGDIALLFSTMIWERNGATYTVQLSKQLTNWFQ